MNEEAFYLKITLDNNSIHYLGFSPLGSFLSEKPRYSGFMNIDDARAKRAKTLKKGWICNRDFKIKDIEIRKATIYYED